MGVPRFAAWIKKKYPGISAKGGKGSSSGKDRRDNNNNNNNNGEAASPVAKVPNRIAALYVDMNGIIHPCCHSEDDPRVAAAPRGEKIERVCQAVDNLVKSLQPETLLYLAMDGVAPRAKMNQQRSRRYMAAVAKHGIVKDGGFAPEEEAATADAQLLFEEGAATAGTGSANQKNTEGGGGDIGESLVSGGGGSNKEKDPSEQQPLPVVVGDDMSAAAGMLDLGIYSVNNNNKKEQQEEATSKKNDEDDLFMDMGSTPSRSEIEQNQSQTNQNQTVETNTNNQEQNPTTYDENLFGGFDSNCISPGTDFMAAITVAVRDLAKRKLASGEWSKDMAVIVSGSEEPGEGEHKLIDFMRRFSPSSGWPRGAHVIHGLDADLILLCLTLHISNVYILRDNDRRVIPLVANDEKSKKNNKESDNLSAANASLAKKSSKKQENKNEQEEEEDDDDEKNNSSSDTENDDDDDDEEEDTTSKMIRSPSRSPALGPHLISPARAKQLSKQGAASSGRKSSMLTATPSPTSPDEALPEISLSKPAENNNSGNKKGGGKRRNQQQNKNESENSGPILTSKQEIFDIYLVAEYIVAEIATLAVSIHGPSIYEHVANNGRQIINDFVFLASILGNDFMPRLPSAFAGEAALDNVYEIYVRNVLGKGFITSPPSNSSSLCKDVDLHTLSLFMEGYAEIEAALFRRFSVSVAKYLPDDASSATGVGFVEKTDSVWADKYYNSTTCTKQTRRDACAKYLEGMRFVFEYYAKTSSSCSWRWFYPFHHAPFAHDFSNYLKELLSTRTSPVAPPVEIDAPSPFVQLLCILPPTSLSLLPPALRKILVHPPENLRSSFPHEWKVDFTCAEGQEHLSTVMIPFADLEGIAEEVKKVLGSSSSSEKCIMTEAQRLRGTNQRELSCIICHDENRFLKKNEMFSNSSSFPTSLKESISTSAKERQEKNNNMNDNNEDESSTTSFKRKARSILHDGGFPATLMNLQLENDQVLLSSSSMNNKNENEDGESALKMIHQSSFLIPEAPPEKPPASSRRAAAVAAAHDTGARRHYPQGLVTVPQLPALPTNWGRITSSKRILPSFGTHLGEILLFLISAIVGLCAFFVVLGNDDDGQDNSSSSSSWTLLFKILAVVIPLFWLIVSVWLPRPGSTYRNQIQDTYCDWLCRECGAVTFTSGLLCFRCGAPYEEGNCPRVFASRLPKTPPVLSVDHSPHLIECLLTIDKKFIEAAE